MHSRFITNAKFNKNLVHVYQSMGFCENLTQLTEDNVVKMFLHLFVQMRNKSMESLASDYTAIEFEFIDQPDYEVQDPNYNTIAPLIFVYMAGLIVKNATDSLMEYQKNRELGLVRAAKDFGLVIDAGNYVVPKKALVILQEFMARNTDILSDTFTTVLGMSNRSNRTSVYSYAHELRGQLEYANMNGVQILEDHILGVKHSCLADIRVAALVSQYQKFKKEAMDRCGDEDWKYVALIDKEVWTKYARTRGQKELRIIATMFASETMDTFNNIIIGGMPITTYKSREGFRKLFNTYSMESHGTLQAYNSFMSKSEVDVIKERTSMFTEVLRGMSVHANRSNTGHTDISGVFSRNGS